MIKFAAFVAGAAALAGIAYTAIAIGRVRKFRNASRAYQPHAATPVTVLKPLCGEEPDLFENLASFCDQEYAEYQVIFGAADPFDPALEIARAVAARFPDRDIEIVAGRAQPAGNPKIGNLLGMIDRVRHPLVVIADSDIRVGRGYLRAVASCFADPRNGAATCIYGAAPLASFASRLGAMQVNDHFAPSVMVATAIEPLTYCFGATMAVRGEVLERIGGLQAVAEHLADDYLLGKLVADAGYRVALVPYAVQTTVSDDSLPALWRHELRWARAIFGQRPAGYAGSVVTYVLPFAAAFALAARTPLSIAALGIATGLRVLLHYEGRRAFAPQTPANTWLIPLRDLFGLAGSFFGKRVLWKTGDYRLDAGGRMAPGTKEV
jgi:ceramide glucosyltransferase